MKAPDGVRRPGAEAQSPDDKGCGHLDDEYTTWRQREARDRRMEPPRESGVVRGRGPAGPRRKAAA